METPNVLYHVDRLKPGGYGPGAVRPAGSSAAGTSREDSLSCPGRLWGRSAAYLWRCRWDTAGLLLRRANDSERGNHLVAVPGGRASGPLAGIGAPTAERAGWGGAAVVLRGRESRSHGEVAPSNSALDRSRREQRFGRSMPLGHPPYLNAKAGGESSMAGKRGTLWRR